MLAAVADGLVKPAQVAGAALAVAWQRGQCGWHWRLWLRQLAAKIWLGFFQRDLAMELHVSCVRAWVWRAACLGGARPRFLHWCLQ